MTLTEHTSPLLLDGAMGTMIQSFSLSEADFRGGLFADSPVLLKGNNDVLNLTRPDVIEEIHRRYLDAGADIISTNTFSSQRISQAEYGLTDHVVQMNMEGARIARKVADEFTATTGRKRFVAGSVGPTTKLLSLSSDTDHPERRDISFDQLAEAYHEQMTALIRGGVDSLLVETALDAINAKAAMYAAMQAMETAGRRVALMLSITVSDAAGRVLSGQTVESFALSLSHVPLFSIGLNCSMGAASIGTALRRLSSVAECRVSVHPNAGLPDQMGEYNDTPEVMCKILKGYVSEGLADIIGGCCGTTPAHIRAFREMLDSSNIPSSLSPSCKAVATNGSDSALKISGQELLILQPGEFMNVGERCNVAGSRKFLNLIKDGKLEEAVAIARKQVEDGAMAIDINMDDGLLDAGRCMEEFVNMLSSDPVAAKVPLMIDSSDFNVILRGVKCSQGKPIVNSISLKDGEHEFLRRARELHKLGVAVIVMAFDERGQAVTYDRKIEICARSYSLLVDEAGFAPSDIIFDPNILTVATGMPEHSDYAIDFVRAATWIHENLPGCRVSGGLSNLSFAFRGNNKLREYMHAVFLHSAVPAGLDMAILNAASSVSYDDVPKYLAEAIEDVLFGARDSKATETLSELAMKLLEDTKQDTTKPSEKDADTEVSPLEALTDALVKGDTTAVEKPLNQLLEKMSPLEIIAGPMMEGMNKVGTLFGEGRIFLPQVVKTARTMKYAVDCLRPYIENARTTDAPDSQVSYSGTVVLATVKGDVHDIGKNIVGMILACNNFKVIDLGVMVPPDAIIEAVERESPDIVCLSGLITPSLQEMIFTVREMAGRGVNVPVMVGGAATSEMHTALKIAPAYGGAVFHVKDASQNPVIAASLTDPARRDRTIADLVQRQEELRTRASQASKAAHSNASKPFEIDTPSPAVPLDLPDVFHIPVSVLTELIDWLYFFHAWKVKGDSKEGIKLKQDALNVLKGLCDDKDACILGKVRFIQAHPSADTIAIGQETLSADRRNGLSLADFLLPEGEPIGMFATTIGEKLRETQSELAAKDVYLSMLMHTLCDRLVEAAAQWLQDRTGWSSIRPAIGYPSLPDQSNIFKLDRLLGLSDIGITLTETGAMIPASSVAGLIMPRGRYF